MIVLITGAAGFLGSHLTERYIHDGHMVIGVDQLLTGVASNLAPLGESESFRLVEADVTEDWLALERTFEQFGRPSLILHFASPASPIDYTAHPLETMRANALGTLRCLDAAVKFGAKIVFASSSEVYGDAQVHPQSETYWGNVNPVGPRSCYDEAKRFGEALVMVYARVSQVDARIVRIFNTYGPRMRADDGRVVPNFVTQALAGKPLTVNGDGTQTRSFCYVDDMVEGIVRCAASDKTRGLIVNLGSPDEIPIQQLARKVCEATGVPLKSDTRPVPADDPVRRCPDISQARALLGWAPTISIEEGLRRTIADFRARP